MDSVAMLCASDCSAVAAGVRRLALQHDSTSAGRIAAMTARELAHADRSRCLFFDAESDVLWSECAASGGTEEHSGNRGVAGWSARTRRSHCADRADRAPHYAAEVDDPEGCGEERILTQPIVTEDGETHAVVVVVRGATRPPFVAEDAARLQHWARQIAPLLHAFELEAQARPAIVAGAGSIYRTEALDAHVRGHEEHGEPLDDAPAWTRFAHWLVCAVLAIAFAYLSLTKVSEYASGTGIVSAHARHDLTATQGGVVGAVEVAVGQRVAPGDVLVQLSDDAELAELHRSQEDLARAVVARLRDPADPGLERQVAQRRSEVERQRARWDQRRMRAPFAGIVADVRAVPGEPVSPGQTVLSLTTAEDGRPTVRAFVPGKYGPALARGQTLLLDLDGIPRATQHLAVERVSAEIVGPAEMQRLVGPQLAGAVPPEGSVVMVEARLPSATIDADGRTWTIHDGMLGRVEIRVGKKRLLFALFPQLEEGSFDGRVFSF